MGKYFGTLTCAICGTKEPKTAPNQMFCQACRRNERKRDRWKKEQAEKANRPKPKPESIASIDRRLKAQGISYGDWSSAETIVRDNPPKLAIPYDGEPEAAVFRFFDAGCVAAQLDPGKTPPGEAEEALVWYIRRVSASIIVYSRGRQIYLVRK